MISRLEQLCLDKGLKMTEQRRVIARVLSESADHPDVEQPPDGEKIRLTQFPHAAEINEPLYKKTNQENDQC